MLTSFLDLQWPVNQSTCKTAAKRRVPSKYPLKAHKSAWIESPTNAKTLETFGESEARRTRFAKRGHAGFLINVVPELMLAFAATRTSQVCRYEVALARSDDFWRALSC